jgi:hypothetical protein
MQPWKAFPVYRFRERRVRPLCHLIVRQQTSGHDGQRFGLQRNRGREAAAILFLPAAEIVRFGLDACPFVLVPIAPEDVINEALTLLVG